MRESLPRAARESWTPPARVSSGLRRSRRSTRLKDFR
jgi:hypothetical protein